MALDDRLAEEFADIAQAALDAAEQVDCGTGEMILGLKLIRTQVSSRITDLKNDEDEDD